MGYQSRSDTDDETLWAVLLVCDGIDVADGRWQMAAEHAVYGMDADYAIDLFVPFNNKSQLVLY